MITFLVLILVVGLGYLAYKHYKKPVATVTPVVNPTANLMFVTETTKKVSEV